MLSRQERTNIRDAIVANVERAFQEAAENGIPQSRYLRRSRINWLVRSLGQVELQGLCTALPEAEAEAIVEEAIDILTEQHPIKEEASGGSNPV